MKEVYLLRHAQLDPEGALTQEGAGYAQAIGRLLPAFDMVITAGDRATNQTAQLMTGNATPDVDPRAGIGSELLDYRQEIEDFELPPNGDLMDYLCPELYSDAGAELREPLVRQARALSDLTFELRLTLPEEGKALVVSYGLLIANAMHLRSQPDEPIAHCHGYVLGDELRKTRFAPELADDQGGPDPQ